MFLTRTKNEIQRYTYARVHCVSSIVSADPPVPSAFPLSTHVAEQRSSLWLSLVVNKIEAEDFRVDIGADRVSLDWTENRRNHSISAFFLKREKKTNN